MRIDILLFTNPISLSCPEDVKDCRYSENNLGLGFLEYYYWDALFIMKGLLASGLHGTAKGMIENFALLIKKYGFIPNGGRVYYLGWA